MKAFRFIPVINIVVIAVCFAGIQRWGWMNSSDTFDMNDVLSMFGHFDNSHYLNNMFGLALFGIPAEILLGKKRYLGWMLVIMAVYVALFDTLVAQNAMGFSGIMYAIPGVFTIGVIRHADRSKNPSWCLMLALSMLWLAMGGHEYTSIGERTVISHEAHFFGFVIGFAVTLVSIPALIRVIKRAWVESQLNQFGLGAEKYMALKAKLAAI